MSWMVTKPPLWLIFSLRFCPVLSSANCKGWNKTLSWALGTQEGRRRGGTLYMGDGNRGPRHKVWGPSRRCNLSYCREQNLGREWRIPSGPCLLHSPSSSTCPSSPLSGLHDALLLLPIHRWCPCPLALEFHVWHRTALASGVRPPAPEPWPWNVLRPFLLRRKTLDAAAKKARTSENQNRELR